MPVNESMIEKLLQNYRDGKFSSQKAATEAYNIPKSTFKDRLHGVEDRRSSHTHMRRLIPAQEEGFEDQRGYPPSHARVRDMAANWTFKGLSASIQTT